MSKSKDKAKVIKIEILLVIVLTICTLFNLTANKIFTAGLLLVSALVVCYLLRHKRILKVNKRKILLIMTIFALFYIALYYTLGIYTGFYSQTHKFGWNTLIKYIIPITITIISTEVIRNKLLIDDSTRSKVLLVIIGTLVDVSIYLDVYGISNLDSFLALVGFVTFAAIANNMLYTYVCYRYGKEAVIVYKLITYLYVYFIPIAPDVYIFFRTFVRMIYPYVIYSYLDKYYDLDKEVKTIKDIRSQIITLVSGSLIMIVVIALISCKFLYGVLVIGSDSMTGTIDKGDVIFFINQKDNIEKKDIIVFKKDDLRIVHRVIDIKDVNHQIRYYTKGDANQSQDDGYVTKGNVVGKVLFKIKYIGRPTLWLREIFNKEG